jgi:peptidoglycan/LPS O-acetylase OafA/YrhL
LGNISYALYLVHQNMGYLVLNKLYAYFGTFQILICVPIIFSIVVAYFITKYLEKPIGKYLHKKNVFLN